MTRVDLGMNHFFRALVKNLSQALGTYGAWVTEFLPGEDRLRALAFWLGDAYVDHYEYSVPGTPCEPAIRNKTHMHIPENVVDLFPGDSDLPGLGAVSYMGYPLLRPEKDVLGNIAVLDTKPMPESYRNLALFRIFAARATADVFLTLFGPDSQSAELASDDDGGIGRNSRIRIELAPGDYFAAVRHYSAFGTGPYSIGVASG